MNGTASNKMQQQPSPSPAAVGPLLRALVRHHVPQSRFDSALAVATRLLDSALTTAPSMQSSDALTRTMTFRLKRDGRDVHANSLATLTTSLKFDRGIASFALWPLLYILNDLRNSSSSAPVNNDNLFQPAPDMRKLSISATPPLLQKRSSSDHDLDSSRLSASSHRNSSSSNVGTPIHSPKVTSSSSNTNITNSTAVRRKNSKEITNSTSSHNRSLEKTLVQDLMLIVQGEQGAHLSFTSGVRREDERIRIDLPNGMQLSLPVHDMVNYIGELGFLFRVIKAHVAPSRKFEKQQPTGLVAQNLHTAIDRELDNYYRSIVSLREPSGNPDFEENTNTLPTLRRMYVWSDRERQRLRYLARICEETRQLHGGQIIAHLRTRTGNYISTEIREMMHRLLRSACAPLDIMLLRWLSEGDLSTDQHGEFFVMEDPKVAASVTATNPFSNNTSVIEEDGLAGGPNLASAASNRIWWGLFKVRNSMIPGGGVLTKESVQNAIKTGKSIAFMRRCCQDSEWVDGVHAPLVESVVKKNGKKRMMFEADLKYDDDVVSEVILKSCMNASKRLKELFFQRFDLSHHFSAIKKYLLLSQGDFAQALMDNLANVLDGGRETLHHNLTGFVDSALQGCSSFNEETDWDILERLDVQIEVRDGIQAKCGWDVFSLTYRVEDAPLNTVFSPKVMDAYHLVFGLLWRLKRMDHLMSLGYSNLRETEKLVRRKKQKSSNLQVMKRVHILRMKIIHLVHNMQHYCKMEVLEGCWATLEREMKEAEDLDEMIVAHARYLTMIKDMTLQSERSQYVAKELNAVLDTVPKFSKLQSDVCEWALQNSDDNGMKRLKEIEDEFDERFSKLLNVLATHCQMVDACVFLLFRLDFNEYYARKESVNHEHTNDMPTSHSSPSLNSDQQQTLSLPPPSSSSSSILSQTSSETRQQQSYILKI